MADLGATVYASVTWTAGDVITEAKLDNMVANDQAYDSHAAQGLLLNNNKAFAAKDSGGTARNLIKMTTSNIVEKNFNWDGWTNPEETWAYASASTITIPAGGASKYALGDRIKWTQTTVKYGVIVAIADTLLTIAVNTDYVVTNAAITLNYYSHEASPIGFPHWFSYTPTFSGIGTVTSDFRYNIIGNNCLLICNISAGTSSNATHTATLPVTAASHNVYTAMLGGDNGGWVAGKLAYITASGTTIQFYVNLSSGANTASGATWVYGIINFQF